MDTTASERGHEGKCRAKKHQGDGVCAKPAGWGTPHVGVGPCRLHGGNTRNHIAAGQQALALKALETYGRPVDTNPVDALLDEVRWTAGHVAWLRQRVQDLEAEALTWGRTETVEKTATEFPGIDTTHTAKINVWLDLYHRERTHLVNVCKSAIAAGLAERQVKLAEQQGAMLAGVIRAILDDIGLSPEQRAKAVEVVPQRLRQVA